MAHEEVLRIATTPVPPRDIEELRNDVRLKLKTPGAELRFCHVRAPGQEPELFDGQSVSPVFG